MRKGITLACLAILAAFANASTAVGITSNGAVYTISDVTGVDTLVNTIGITGTFCLAYNPADQFFYTISDRKLYRFTLGGQAVLRRDLSGFLADNPTTLAIDRAGILWTIHKVAGQLVRFGSVSGNTNVAPIESGLRTGSLVFNTDGSLYLTQSDPLASNAGLFIIDKLTGQSTHVNTVDLSNTDIGAPAVPGNIVGGIGSITCFFNTGLRLNALSGALTNIGGSTSGIQGLAYEQKLPFAHPAVLGTVNFGQVNANSATSLDDRDRDVLRVCKFFVPNNTSPFAQFTVKSQIVANAQTLAYTFTRRMVTSGSFIETVSILNVNTGLFERATQASTSNQFTTDSRAINDFANFVSANREVTFKIEVRQAGPSSNLTPCYEADQFVIQTTVP